MVEDPYASGQVILITAAAIRIDRIRLKHNGRTQIPNRS
jgi:hypothetical protein